MRALRGSAALVTFLCALTASMAAAQSSRTYTCDASARNMRRLARACDVRRVDTIVCINDFIYQPPLITVREGDTVAWVNVEKCADPAGGPVNVVEDAVANKGGAGCDTHHEVVTLPDESALSPDSLDARICSPNRGIAANPSNPPVPGFTINQGKCGDPTDPEFHLGETNVFCHTFQEVGAQQYTCLTNPGHTAVLHGGVIVLPKIAPKLPVLPQTPGL